MLKISEKALGLSGLGESFQSTFSTIEIVLRTANVDAEVPVQHQTNIALIFLGSHAKRHSQGG